MNEIIVQNISDNLNTNIDLLTSEVNEVNVYGQSNCTSINIDQSSNDYEIEIKQNSSPLELIILNAFTVVGTGGGGEFDPGNNYTITGEWLFTKTISTSNHGTSENWWDAYETSLLGWQIDGDNIFYDRGVAAIGGQQYHGLLSLSPGETQYKENVSFINNSNESVFSIQSFFTPSPNPRFLSIATQTGESGGIRAFKQLFSFNEDGKFGIGTVVPSAAITIDAGYEKNGITQLQPLEITNLLGDLDKKTYFFNMRSKWMSISTKDDNKVYQGDIITFGHDGSIGFNTSDPTNLVEIHSKGDATYIQKWYDHLGIEIGGLLQYAGSIPKLYLGEAGSEEVMIAHTGKSWFNGGYVGFGTNNPLYQIHAQEIKPSRATYKFENLDSLGEVSLEVDSDEGSVYVRNYGSNAASLTVAPLTDWKGSAVFGADNTLDGGLVFYNSTSLGSRGIRFQNDVGVDLFVISGNVPRFKYPTIFEERAGTDGFASGFAGQGWEVKDYTISGPARYTSTFDNIVVRRTLKVYELEINKIRASNGSLWVSDAMEAEYVQTVSGGFRIKVLDELNMPFLLNDIVRTQKFTGDAVKFWLGKVVAIGSETISGKLYGYAEVQEYPAGSGYTDSPEENDVFVRVDNTTNNDRKGAVYLTSSDTGSPFMDVTFGMETDASGGVKVRVGRLAGITDTEAGLDGGSWQNNLFGLYGQNVHLKGHIFAQTGEIGGWKIADYKLWSGADWFDGAAIDAGIEINARDLQQVIFRDSVNYIKLYNNNDQDWGIEGSVAGSVVFDLGYAVNGLGDIYDGQIAKWYFKEGELRSRTSIGNLTLYSENSNGYPSIFSYLSGAAEGLAVSVGQLYFNNSWQDEFGFSLSTSPSANEPFIQFSRNISDGTLLTAKISNWYFNETQLRSQVGSNLIYLASTQNSGGPGTIMAIDTVNKVRVGIGNQYWNSQWTNEYGFALTNNYEAGDPYVQFTKNMTTNVLTAKIAGWTFTPNRFYRSLSNTYLGIGDGAWDDGTTYKGFYVRSGDGLSDINMMAHGTNNINVYLIGRAPIDGVRTEIFRLSTTGSHISGWNFDDGFLWTGSKFGLGSGIELSNSFYPRIITSKDSTSYINMYYLSDTNWGINGVNGSQNYFQLGSMNQIAGWTFDHEKITSTNITIHDGVSSIYVSKPQGGNVMMGQTYYNGVWQGQYGFSATDANGDLIFLMDGSAQTIAGWNFTPYRMTKTISGSTVWQGAYIDSNPSTAVNFGFGIKSPDGASGSNHLYMINSTTDGAGFLVGVRDGAGIFYLTTRSSLTSYISGFNFDKDKLYTEHGDTMLTMGKISTYNYGFEAYVDSSNYIAMFNNELDDHSELIGKKDGDTIFKLTTLGTNSVSGFNFDSTKFYSTQAGGSFPSYIEMTAGKTTSYPRLYIEKNTIQGDLISYAELREGTLRLQGTSSSVRFHAYIEGSRPRIFINGLRTSAATSGEVYQSNGYLRIVP